MKASIKAAAVWVFALAVVFMFFVGVGTVCEKTPGVAELAIDSIALAFLLNILED